MYVWECPCYEVVHATCPRRCRCGLSLWQDSAVLEWRVSLWDCRPGPVDRCICPGCTSPMATCVMTVSVSTLLTGRCGCNCLYLSWLRNKSLAKRSFRKVILADSCRGSNLATPSSSVSCHECGPNRACQEGRNFAPVHAIWPCVFLSVLSLCQNYVWVYPCFVVLFRCVFRKRLRSYMLMRRQRFRTFAF